MACPPSARLESLLPESTSRYADEGTLAHSLGEWIIRLKMGWISDQKFQVELKKIKKSEHYCKELHDYADDYAMFVFSKFVEVQAVDPTAIIQIEQRLDYSDYVAGGFGTGDVIIIGGGWLYLIDLKYGAGVKVEAHENSQLKLYGLGALSEYDYAYKIDNVSLNIYQPRMDNFPEFTISVPSLKKWGKQDVMPKAKMAWDGKGEFCAGDHCRFCKVYATCKTRMEYSMGITKYDYLKANLMKDSEVAEVLEKGGPIKSWITAVEKYALEQAVNEGKQWPGFKVVAGRSNRFYTKPEKIAEILKKHKYADDDIFNKTLVGIGGLEKLLGKEQFNILVGPYTAKPDGAPTLVDISDTREPYVKGGKKKPAKEAFADFITE
ncbi:DUF2800 domain-containing protein [Niabella terrae]